MTRLDASLLVLDILHDAHIAGASMDAATLAAAAGLGTTRVAEILLHLDQKGLVDAERARLTMAGLAASHALAGAARTATFAA